VLLRLNGDKGKRGRIRTQNQKKKKEKKKKKTGRVRGGLAWASSRDLLQKFIGAGAQQTRSELYFSNSIFKNVGCFISSR